MTNTTTIIDVEKAALERQVAALTEQRDAKHALLVMIEWIDVNHDGSVVCPGCRAWRSIHTPRKERTHTDGCQLAAAIAQGEPKQ